MDDISTFLQIIFWGLYAGCIYILLATGLNLIFGVMKVVNFAHGEFLMIGAYITATIFLLTGINPYVIMLVSMLALIVMGAAVERLCFRPILGTGKLNEIFLSIGLIYIIQNGAAIIWTDEWQSIRSPYNGITVPIGTLDVPLDYILIMIITAAILCGLYLFIRKTTIGMQMQAASQNRKGAMLVGIDVERIDVVSFGLGCALAAAAGTLWVVSGQVFNPYIGSIPAVKAFAIIILGGLGSIPGAVIGGLLMGLAENGAAYLLGGIWKDAISFVILIVVLIVRPTGLFGEKED
ncbi:MULTISPECIES: branched-chain amino acid ABC transporter permease [unclassified Methanoregula]|uniref:branched-chain amino acid ABC transporter permease n=1 Tax=unclassified Methanoregula TaxID=2649730 RepID=UPI0009C7E76D|nr:MULTISPECIES: branched-chain amino acid ABC transporter permease [unclassified Methanoregula]OPX65040.1 MAG: branched-chain amino acid transporter permease subunit LivH [Methanoregula sp. PtaB.Bin085]OPY32356.1 MAG: branched-chain amino acid transporter permease subunit LivH [Methanoregula sp. PtaU1.Bin006]